MAEFIGVKSYKARGKRLTSFMVENIQELEPIVKKESQPVTGSVQEEEEEEEETQHTEKPSDPAQMKLEL